MYVMYSYACINCMNLEYDEALFGMWCQYGKKHWSMCLNWLPSTTWSNQVHIFSGKKSFASSFFLNSLNIKPSPKLEYYRQQKNWTVESPLQITELLSLWEFNIRCFLSAHQLTWYNSNQTVGNCVIPFKPMSKRILNGKLRWKSGKWMVKNEI